MCVSFYSQVPLEAFFESIDAHFNSVEYVNKLHADLELHGKRFRAVQKRLLLRFKDRKPEPLAHMEALLDDTCVAACPPHTHTRSLSHSHSCALNHALSIMRSFIRSETLEDQGFAKDRAKMAEK